MTNYSSTTIYKDESFYCCCYSSIYLYVDKINKISSIIYNSIVDSSSEIRIKTFIRSEYCFIPRRIIMIQMK